MTKQGFLYGTLVLVGAGLLTKILGFIYRIALSRIIGDEGMGLFHMAFPILIFAVVITTAGLPVAISKMVSEAEARGEEHRVRSILAVSLFIVGLTSVLVTFLILAGAPWITGTLLTDDRALYTLIGIAPIIPVIAVSTVFRGYFQGRQNMSPYALSTIIEQSVRIVTVLLLASWLLPKGVEYAAAGAMIGMVIGEFSGLMFLIWKFKKDPKRPRLFGKPVKEKKDSFLNRSRDIIRELLKTAIPVTASRVVGSFSYAIEPIVVSQSLAFAGIATSVSTALYGQLEGMAVPLVFFPTFITYALTVSLVPAVSEAAAQNRPTLVEHRLQQAIRLSLITTVPCAILLYMLAEPLSVLLYRQPEVARLIKIMAPFTIVHALQGPFASVLQGLDHATVSMKNSIVGAVLKTGLILLLASRPELGIDGVALAINGGILCVTMLHFISLAKIAPFTLNLRDFGKLALAAAAIPVTASFLDFGHLSLLEQTLYTTLISLGAYLLMVILLRLIKRDDLSKIPFVGKWAGRFFPT
ncbi:stage V sporulation protein B [Staphylospora marina]|uniref:stage V sporulation protein B n=1 Tax=Staphylospora marina TaxID=2490858 RepID=UPI001F15566F|nr:stage V sporulation protein B [Staphylospora marina]